MIREVYDLFLNILTRHTNRMIPYSEYVNGHTFPEQISELIDTTVTLKYRNHYIYDIENLNLPATITRNGEVIPSRPEGDEPFEVPDRKYDDPTDIFEGEFRIVRADAIEPYRLIAISIDYNIVAVSTTEKDFEGNYKFLSIVQDYVVQHNEFIGLGVYSQYPESDVKELKAATIRVDAGEPCYSVVMENLGSTGVVRFVLGDECKHLLYDYYDIDGSRDYDAHNAPELENPIDVTGEWADADHHGYIFTDVNGGHSNNWDQLYIEVMTNDEVREFREKLLEGKTIYGAN